jgi:hypothetical protein
MRIVRPIVGLFVLALSVASLAAQTQRPPDDGLIVWSAGRKLTRADFKSKTPSRGPATSTSFVSIETSWECQEGQGISSVRAVFDPARSWWQENPPRFWQNIDDPALMAPQIDGVRILLAHEQTHFDITELWARKLKATFAGLPAACKSHEGIHRMEEAVQSLEQELREEQARYDKETAHGTNPRQQSAWELKIKKALQ